jgi:hypothetical protein
MSRNIINVINPCRILLRGRFTTSERYAPVFCKIEYKDNKLSITGVEAPLKNGDCLGGCGQIVDTLKYDLSLQPEEGWDEDMIAKFVSIWERWHLNDMNAGSPLQERAVRAWKMHGRAYDYVKIKSWLTEGGLNPDPCFKKDGKDYDYGSGWIAEEVPDDVLEWLDNLPFSKVTPNWI